MNPARSFLLLIGDDGALLVPPFPNSDLEPLYVTGHDDIQALPILEAMAERPRVPVFILADTLAQEFRRDTLPRLNFFDRQKVLARRLHQHFPPPLSEPHTQLSAALPLKKNAALFACLHDGGPIAAWLTRFDFLDNPFGGTLLLPLACAGMTARLMPEAHKGWAMLLSWQRTGGFRQIVTHDGELVFTRLTPPLPLSASPSYVAATLTLDLQATLGYLARLGMKEGEPLRLAAIMPTMMHRAIGALPPPIQTLVMIEPHRAAQKLGLPFAPDIDEPASDLVYAAWVAKQKHLRGVLLPDEKRQAYQTARLKRWGSCTAALVWLLILSSLGWQGHDLFRLAVASRHSEQDFALLQKQFEQERTTLAPVTEPLGRLRQAVARQRLFTASVSEPWPLLRTLGKEIGTAARVTKLNWQSGKTPAKAETLQIGLRLTESTSPSAAKEAGRQKIIRSFDRLAQSLRTALPDYDVTVTRYPFLIKPDDTLSNANDKPNDTTLPTADFLVQRGKL